ncbi:hypothetical protein [Streptomyces sp. NPDC012746]
MPTSASTVVGSDTDNAVAIAKILAEKALNGRPEELRSFITVDQYQF